MVLMGLSILLIPKLGSEFMPKAVSSEFTIELTLPEGTNLERNSEHSSENGRDNPGSSWK